MREFIPFSEIGEKTCIVVDALHPEALVLSHWKGGNKHPKIAADTSGEIVLNALQSNFHGLESEFVSANHFDIDGFVGVFSLVYPELAKKYDAMLREMAIIGDFREYKPQNKNSQQALQLCCWMNKVESEKFYRPFGEKDEMKLCVKKFDYFLAKFPEVLQEPEKFKADWEEEVGRIEADLELLQSKGKREFLQGLKLMVQEVPQPIHYYVAFSDSYGFDMVMNLYDENRFELECKYTTWVDIASRPTLPRVNLQPLAKQLNKIEENDYQWEVDKITDTGPILRLESKELSKADRFDQPYRRAIYSSTIPKEVFKKTVLDFLSLAYQNIEPKRFWTWDEMRAFNKS
ncbi:MAG: hypothetical protein RIC95_02760 [Vicingaceae bacterium]